MSSESGLPTPTPPVNPETEPFWEATAEDRFLIQECQNCGRVYYYPRAHCPDCFEDTVEWVEASGEGTIYSFSLTYGGVGGPWAEATPFVLAYVELEEGPRVLTNLVVDEEDFDDLSVGDQVSVTFDETDHDEGYKLPRFEPA